MRRRRSPPPIFSWTGCYLGIDGGGILGQSQHTSAASSANTGRPIENSISMTRPVRRRGRLQLSISNVVVGVENDFSWTNPPAVRNDIARSIWRRSARQIRAGSILCVGARASRRERFYFYGTGGAAFSNVGVTVCAPGGCISNSQTRTGWTAGVGAEWAAWPVPVGTSDLQGRILAR